MAFTKWMGRFTDAADAALVQQAAAEAASATVAVIPGEQQPISTAGTAQLSVSCVHKLPACRDAHALQSLIRAV